MDPRWKVNSTHPQSPPSCVQMQNSGKWWAAGTDGESEGLESTQKEGTARLQASIRMGWNAGLLFFLKRWDYAALLLKPSSCKWIDFWNASTSMEEDAKGHVDEMMSRWRLGALASVRALFASSVPISTHSNQIQQVRSCGHFGQKFNPYFFSCHTFKTTITREISNVFH